MAIKKDAEFYRKIGAKGGKATLANNGPEHFSTIGKKGGNALLASKGVDYYAQIGAMPDKKPRRKA